MADKVHHPLSIPVTSLGVFLTLALATAIGWQFSAPTGGAYAVRVDDNGAIYSAGEVDGDFAVVKVRGDGPTEIWRHLVEEGQGGVANAAVLDSSGNVIAGGRANGKFMVAKVSTAGSELWAEDDSGTASSSVNEARAVVVDANDDVIAAGWVSDTGLGSELIVVKRDGSDGALLWSSKLQGGSSDDYALAVTVDSEGDVVASGRFGGDFYVAKFDGNDGTKLWDVSRSNGLGRTVIVDSSDDIFAGGRRHNSVSGRQEFYAVKISSAGSLAWERFPLFPSDGDSESGIMKLAFTPLEGVVAVGCMSFEEGEGTTERFAAITYSTDGITMWCTYGAGITGCNEIIDSVGDECAYDVQVAVTSTAPLEWKVFAVGSGIDSFSNSERWLITKLDGGDGVVTFTNPIANPDRQVGDDSGSGSNVARALAIDAALNPIIAGEQKGPKYTIETRDTGLAPLPTPTPSGCG